MINIGKGPATPNPIELCKLPPGLKGKEVLWAAVESAGKAMFGDEWTGLERRPVHLSAIEANQYLVEKYHWLPFKQLTFESELKANAAALALLRTKSTKDVIKATIIGSAFSATASQEPTANEIKELPAVVEAKAANLRRKQCEDICLDALYNAGLTVHMRDSNGIQLTFPRHIWVSDNDSYDVIRSTPPGQVFSWVSGERLFLTRASLPTLRGC